MNLQEINNVIGLLCKCPSSNLSEAIQLVETVRWLTAIAKKLSETESTDIKKEGE